MKLADEIMRHPGGTLPDKINSPANLKAMYRLMNGEQVTHAAVIAGPCADAGCAVGPMASPDRHVSLPSGSSKKPWLTKTQSRDSIASRT